MPWKARKIRSALQRKGFRQREGDHTYFTLYVGDRKTSIWTKISHGNVEYSDDLLGRHVTKQLKLDRRRLDELIECPMSGEDYVSHLREAGHIQVDNPPPARDG